MRYGSIARVGMLCAAGVMAALAGSITAQTQTAETGAASPLPRMPDGRPDLQGVWSYASSTPFQAPGAQVDPLFAPDETAADLDRTIGNYNQFWYETGTGATDRKSLVIDPPSGIIPPLTPEAAAEQMAIRKERAGMAREVPTPGGWVEDLGPTHLKPRCLVSFNAGPPMTPAGYNQHVQIFQAPGYIVLFTEMIHTARIVPMDGRPHGQFRRWAGDSRGRWDGDTLVVDTINFRDATLAPGGPLSADMHLVERFTRVGEDTLLYRFTVEDPKKWTRPWTAEIPLSRTEERIHEYACHEGNYGLHNMLAGARREEREREQAAGPGR